LYSYFGTLYGSGDDSTTFGLPDFRGLFLKGLPEAVQQPSGILPSGYIPDAFASHNHYVTMAGNTGYT
jgi:microcystin-dependent protein